MLREFLVLPRTGRIDWWLIALLLISLLSFRRRNDFLDAVWHDNMSHLVIRFS
jgi:hypothetical protein